VSIYGGIRHRPWLIVAIAIGALIVAAVVVIVARFPDPAVAPGLAQRQPDAARGAYIAVLGDCAFCHTGPRGQAFAGGLKISTPIGAVYSSNITPDPDTGIGRYSLKDFIRALRFGVRPDGARLYPAMPYTAYARVTDQDLQDLLVYLKTAVAPVHEASRSTDISWPLKLRWPLALWNAAFHDPTGFQADASKDDQWNRGAYLVEGLAHCGTCHTPRGLFFEEKDARGTSNLYLSGTRLDDLSPINLRGNEGDGLGRWSADAIASLLKSGRNEHSAVTGSMTDVVRHSTQFMTEQDVGAIAAYLKSLSPAPGKRASFAANDTTTRAILAGNEQSPGGRIYLDSCAACHRLTGGGESLTFPTLAGNSTVLNSDPSSLLAVILSGARAPATDAAPTGLAMPAFGWRYDDSDIAALATFIRTSWGNDAAPVSAAQVSQLRRELSLNRATSSGTP
jgi:mono/diheme cytochrome c family protein